ncbi:hypothetical protein ACHHYP_20542 [Achlya hypogyna]|uniref:Uncharacterized protein n=1 Tax=Achlya hypogyna TaxID=1202772 RepID=A0A1V9YJ86_ACHHY|nr:hypothetical protein ACHHYP_20542 [Achlya hypogyna]
MSDVDAKLSFRFDVLGILRLSFLLGIPNASSQLGGSVHRSLYPIVYYDMIKTFGRSRSQLCRIFNHTVDLIYERWLKVIYFAPCTDRAHQCHKQQGCSNRQRLWFTYGTKRNNLIWQKAKFNRRMSQ